MNQEILGNSPIREAVFDVRLKFDKLPHVPDLDALHKKLNSKFPKKEANFFQTLSVEVKLGEAPLVNSGGGPNGVRFTSEDSKKIVQCRTDGFTFSHLSPYPGWEEFIKQVREFFDLYLEAAGGKPEAVRIALRYINAIKVPEKAFKLDDYFNSAPVIGESIPQEMLFFFSRVAIKDSESDSIGVINQTVEEGGSEGVTVLFDIDVYQENISVAPNSDEFWKRFKELKEFRTVIFKGSMTDKAMALFV